MAELMKLKPCPFCGSEPITSHPQPSKFIITCGNSECRASVYVSDDFDLPVEAWNTRAEEPTAERTAAADNVNHPSHYETNGIECIVAMEAVQGADAVQDFCICNAFKYIWRHKHKNGAEDIKKAVWYLTKWLELERRYKTGNERF